MNLSKKIIASVSFIVIIIGGIVIYNIKNPTIKGLQGGRGIIKYNGQLAMMDSFFGFYRSRIFRAYRG